MEETFFPSIRLADAPHRAISAEVFDLETGTWDFLFAFTPKMPLKIQRSVATNRKEVYAVDEDGENFIFSPAKSLFVATGKTDSSSEPEYRNDWCFIGRFLFCGGNGGRILWCLPYDFHWKEVKGLEALCGYDICRLCRNHAGKMFIFWKAPHTLELWSAEISLQKHTQGPEVRDVCDWSGAVLSLDSCAGVNVLFAAFAYV